MTTDRALRFDRSLAGQVVIEGAAWQRVDVVRVLAAPLFLAPVAYVVWRELAGLSEMLFAMGLAFSGFIAWRATRVRVGVRARIDAGELEVRQRLRRRRLPRVEVGTLYVAYDESHWFESYVLCALLASGEQRQLARAGDGELLLALERALEVELGLVPQAVQGAVERPRPESTVPWIQLVGSVVLGAFVIWQALTTGRNLAELEVGNAPGKVDFTLAESASILLRSEIHNSDAVPAPQPPALVYQVAISTSGKEVSAMTCDPYAAKTHLWQTGSGRSVRAFFVELPGCTLELPPGTHTLTAHRVWRAERTSSKVATTKLFVTEN